MLSAVQSNGGVMGRTELHAPESMKNLNENPNEGCQTGPKRRREDGLTLTPRQ